MNDPSEDLLVELPSSLARRLDETCNRFEAAWRNGERPRMDDFLSGPEDELYPALLRELATANEAHQAGLSASTLYRFLRARGLLREGLSRDFDIAVGDAFSFDGVRCDRIVAGVLARLDPVPPSPAP